MKKIGLKLNIQKTNIMASDPITSWQIDQKTVETVTDFIFEGSKITADGDCSHEIKSSHAIHLKLIYSAICVCLYISQLYLNKTEKAVR